MDKAYFTFHHIGIGVKSIEKERCIYESLGFQEERPLFISEKNQLRGLFMVNGETRIELLEDLPGSAKIASQTGNRSNFIHSAYQVAHIPEAVERLKENMVCTIPRKMSPAEYPDPLFLMLKNGTIIELLTDY